MAEVNQVAANEKAADKPIKKSIVEVFMKGAKKGFYIGVEQILPAMILGYVIIQFLKLTGLINILNIIFGPIMGIFGLPGEAIVVIISAFFSKAAGAAAAANLFSEGVLSAAQCTILIMPCMLMGTLVGHFARIILVSGVNPKHRGLMLLVPIVDSILGMFVMRIILTVMGLM
ncbi:MAG: nucleoside recognition protein [Clostridia bacterium]|jgi:spore maturation protein SpmB|nr:nucleoside recognition protein [Clostridia bacterium]MCI1959821.1 nucleoside recognition protein [Clostridia bacterium]MCI1999789.1 nucleoside recognition protein [Clostridia bacterium]MCI2014295.1 nucleoside recognition protein [Clostridia bacterium]